MTACPFCTLPQSRIIKDTEHFVVIRDNYPVTKLHTLVISKRHAETFFDLNAEEQTALNDLLHDLRAEILQQDNTVTGFNIGMNCGTSAGQTVMHFHGHLIPRRDGDMQDPKGGVRGVIPDKQKY